MIEFTRRTLIGTLGALPARPAEASLSVALTAMATAQASDGLLCFESGPGEIENLPLWIAQEHFSSVFAPGGGQEGSFTAALQAVARRPGAVTCCPVEWLVEAWREGLPLVSIAEIGAGGHRTIVVRADSNVQCVRDLAGKSVVVNGYADRARWEAIAAANKIESLNLVEAKRAAWEHLDGNAQIACSLSPIELSLAYEQGAALRELSSGVIDKGPYLTVATHRASINGEQTRPRLKTLLLSLARAHSFIRARPETGAEIARRRLNPAWVAPTPKMLLRAVNAFRARLEAGGQGPFGVHHPERWDIVLGRYPPLRAGNRADLWTDALLPARRAYIEEGRRIAELEKINPRLQRAARELRTPLPG